MTLEEATEILETEGLVSDNGNLFGGGREFSGWTDWRCAWGTRRVTEKTILLDGRYTVEVLEAIVVWIKHYGK